MQVTLDEPPIVTALKHLEAGHLVVIERKGRPWKLSTVERRGPDSIEVTGGHRYSVQTGKRLRSEGRDSFDRLVLATPVRLAYLEVRDFLNHASKVRLESLRTEELLELVELARQFRRLTGR